MIYGSSNFFYRPKANLFCSKFVSRVIFMLLLKRPDCYNTRVVKRATSPLPRFAAQLQSKKPLFGKPFYHRFT